MLFQTILKVRVYVWPSALSVKLAANSNVHGKYVGWEIGLPLSLVRWRGVTSVSICLTGPTSTSYAKVDAARDLDDCFVKEPFLHRLPATQWVGGCSLALEVRLVTSEVFYGPSFI